MTTIDIPRPGAGQSEYARELRRQQDAASERMHARSTTRITNTTALAGPDGLVKVNEFDRVANRMDRVRAYRANTEPSGTAGAAPEIAAASAGATEVQLERIINTPDFLEVRYLDEGVAAARAVGRVHVVDSGGPAGFGTGFLVSPRLLLTNHHVLAGADIARHSAIEFGFQDGAGGTAVKTTRLGFAPDVFFIADRDLDFALVAVDATPEVLAPFGFNRLTAAQGTILIGEYVTIIQHPGGRKKQIALRENKVVDIPEIAVTYSADTEPGSSGSPVFNDQWEVIALHHASVPTPGNEQFAFLNEGIRISRILRFLDAQPLPGSQRALLTEDLPKTPAAGPVAAEIGQSALPTTEPVRITVQFNGSVVRAVGVVEPDHEAIDIDPDYSGRDGYDADFLGVTLPLPEATAPLSPELRYHHFSVRLHTDRRLAMFTAVNIAGPVTPIVRERDRWTLDPRLPADQQTGEDVYRDNDLDRGHLVRRLDPAWGPNAKAANDDTFHFTNCAPQHHDFNAGQTKWLGLEDYILTNADNHRLAVSVLTGPVFADDDPHYRGVQLPRQYWKVVSMVKADGTLSATGYLLSQAALLDGVVSHEAFSFGAYRTFQVPVATIAELTGLVLTDYVTADPLARLEACGLPREILRDEDILL
jgi:endonuclease G